MLPSQPQLTGKRKPEDSNPLLNAAAAKRAKKEGKLGASSKRKLDNDEGPGGLLIVRAPESQPSHSQPTTSNHTDSYPPRFLSQPVVSEAAGILKPPSKKFRADSETSSRPRGNSKSKSAARDRVAYSVAYDDSEVEKDVRAMEDETDHLRRNSRAHTTINASLLAGESSVHFPPRSGPPDTSRSKGKSKVTEISTILPESETPQIERNKQLRQAAMDAITGGRGRTTEPHGNDSVRSHRRKSSVNGRGKRTSTAFETTGVITQGAQLLKSLQDDLIRMLAEKRVDLSLYSSEASSSKQPQEDLRENEQNVRNRQWEVTYTQHIQQAQAEEESWKKVSYGYDAYSKKLHASLEKRSTALQLNPQALSAKAKGKRRATGELDDLESHSIPQEHEIPPEFHSALALAKSVLGHRPIGDDRIPSRRGMTGSNLSREEMEAELKRRLPSLEYKVDQIFSFASAARVTTNIAEKALNERFDIISANLTSRMNPFPPPGDVASGSSTQLLSTYVAQPNSESAGADPLDLMRALSRVDQERPPAQVGDAARRAAREVQRAGENGAGAVGDRRLTGVPATPKKMPGTPRRGNTPSRDR
ncbi:hypothetical protein BDZ97DRAFT_1752852 [Flammula alnicola]|nr:hypothetical protein BDZ97DRAFT_1752852 [Flammula alnicola]